MAPDPPAIPCRNGIEQVQSQLSAYNGRSLDGRTTVEIAFIWKISKQVKSLKELAAEEHGDLHFYSTAAVQTSFFLHSEESLVFLSMNARLLLIGRGGETGRCCPDFHLGQSAEALDSACYSARTQRCTLYVADATTVIQQQNNLVMEISV